MSSDDGMDILMDNDDVALDSADSGASFSLLAVLEKPEAKDTHNHLTETTGAFRVKIISHAEFAAAMADELAAADVLTMEVRLMELFEDLSVVREIRRSRPLMPIVALGENPDPDMVKEILGAGCTDYMTMDSRADVMAMKLESFCKLSASARLIEVKNNELVQTMQAQREEHEKRISAEKDKASALAQAEVDRQTRDILDNLREAFFSVDSRGVIGSATSKSCVEIFSGPIADQILGTDCLSLSGDQENYFRLCLEQVFEGFMPVEVSLSMVPSRFRTKKDRVLDAAFTPAFDESGQCVRVIVCARDITQEEAERTRVEREVQQIRSFIHIIKDRVGFADFLSDYRAGAAKLVGQCSLSDAKGILHTLKGNCGAYGLFAPAELLHACEDQVSTAEAAPENNTMPDLLSRIGILVLECLESFLKDNFEVLQIAPLDRDAYGAILAGNPVEENDLAASTAPLLNSSQYEMLKERILVLPSDAKGVPELRGFISDLEKAPLGSLISTFKPTVTRIGERLGKSIEFKSVGDDLRVEARQIGMLVKSLIHCVRNSCDHGIETPEERERVGKSPEAHLTISFSVFDVESDVQKLRVEIEDDGRGINRDVVIKRAVEKRIVAAHAVEKLRARGWTSLLFHEGFSTAEKVTDLSGRGVGLAAVAAEVKRLGGRIAVSTRLGLGTKFTFEVPLQSSVDSVAAKALDKAA